MKLYYSIKEVAEILDVEQSLLRFWEKEFTAFVKPHRSPKGIRLYRKEDIEVLKKIHFFVKEQGLTLSGAKKKMKENPENESFNHEIYERLKNIREELVTLRKALTLPTEKEEEENN